MLWIDASVLTKLDPNYESKLVDKTVELYLKKRNFTTKQKVKQVLKKYILRQPLRKTCCFLPNGFYLMDQTSSSLLFQDVSYIQLSGSDAGDDISDSINDDTLSDEDDVDVTSIIDIVCRRVKTPHLLTTLHPPQPPPPPPSLLFNHPFLVFF